MLVEAGVNAKLKEAEPPAAREAGSVKPEMENPVPETVAWEMLSVAVPWF